MSNRHDTNCFLILGELIDDAKRADAQRNRDRLVEVAVRTLSQDGPDVTLEAIATDAGVGRTGA